MMPGMGNDHLQADTGNSEAQAWFDYGLTLARSFEHGDAILAFQKAETSDPTCSLCVWGEAWARGPTINFPVSQEQSLANLAMARRAQAMASPDIDPVTKALEAALVDKYDGGNVSGAGDLAYARDIDALNHAHAGNVEVAIFDAEAWLIREGDNDTSGLKHAVAVLQPLLRTNGNSSGLLHFFIHATEDAGEPELATPYAERVAQLAPSASHMVHMPSHTYFRIGRYEDAALDNLAALKVDLAYAKGTDFPTPLGKMQYHFHDVQFGVVSAMMSGDGALALKFVKIFNQDFPDPENYDPRAELAGGMVWAAYGRFASAKSILSAPDTVSAHPILEAMRHYARGEAYVRLGQSAGVRAEAEQVGAALATSTVAKVARLTLLGRADLLDGRAHLAAGEFQEAGELQETRLTSPDPPRWWYPIRRDLAVALYRDGDPAGAEREAAKVLASWKLDPVTLEIRSRAERALHEATAQQDQALAQKWRGSELNLLRAADGLL
jgi:tetratricopeptide (TPR) repeat protein